MPHRAQDTKTAKRIIKRLQDTGMILQIPAGSWPCGEFLHEKGA